MSDQSYAKIIADSISPSGYRVTTMEVRFHRFVLAEFNTHRVFSRNSASSRAIPAAKQIRKVELNPALPVVWPGEQRGMQGGEQIESSDQAEAVWREAADDMVIRARRLTSLGVHKSVTNRLLEPFQMHTVVVTATDWVGFFAQRCSPLAQPEIRVAAEKMLDAYDASTPQELDEGDWHLPYIDADDVAMAEQFLLNQDGSVSPQSLDWLLVKMSTARCARVSYETQDGKRDVKADVDLYERLITAEPAHWSPLEHPCSVWENNVQIVDGEFIDRAGEKQSFSLIKPIVGNFLGWRQHRFEMETA